MNTAAIRVANGREDRAERLERTATREEVLGIPTIDEAGWLLTLDLGRAWKSDPISAQIMAMST